ncbi:hypothetical protein J6590_071660, partial [Homalodisca vitripennis]
MLFQTIDFRLLETEYVRKVVTSRVPVGCIGGIEVVNVGFYQGATPWRVTYFRDNTGTCPSRSCYSSHCESRNRPQSPQLLSNNVYTSSIFEYGHKKIKKARDSATSQVVTQGSELRLLLTVSEAPSIPRVQSVPLNVQALETKTRTLFKNIEKSRKSSHGAEE